MLKKLTAFAASRKRITLTLVLASSDQPEPTFHAILTPRPREDGKIAADEQPLKFTGTTEDLEEQIAGTDMDQYLTSTGEAPSNLTAIIAKIEAERATAAKKKSTPPKKKQAVKPAKKTPAAKKKQAVKPTPKTATATNKPAPPAAQALGASAPATPQTLESILS
jgi:PRTRC genetic system protein E